METYSLTTKSIKSVATGMINKPKKKIGHENNMLSIPRNSAANGSLGQKLLYAKMKINHKIIEPQIEQCVNHVHEFIIRPAFRQTVTTTYCIKNIKQKFKIDISKYYNIITKKF